MSAEVWMLVATAVLAVVAISAAVVAVRAARRIAVPVAPPVDPPVDPPTSSSHEIAVRAPSPPAPPAPPQARLVEGRVMVPPTQQQVVQTVMGRPGVRLSVLAHGVAHALREESRDRIAALMRREYRRRRRERLQAGRRAVRSAQPTPPADQWLGS